jgi:hypothetical protein
MSAVVIALSSFASISAASSVQKGSGGSQAMGDRGSARPQEGKSAVQVRGKCIGCAHDEMVVGRWSLKHFPASYAGMYFAKSKVARLVVGFTDRQAKRVRALERLPGLIVPSRIRAFPSIPEYSLAELAELQEQIVHEVMRGDAHSGLLVSVGVTIEDNRVDVGSQDIARARKVLGSLFGRDAPIRVRYEGAPAEV